MQEAQDNLDCLRMDEKAQSMRWAGAKIIPEIRLILLDRSYQICGGFMICMEMCMSGLLLSIMKRGALCVVAAVIAMLLFVRQVTGFGLIQIARVIA